MSSSTSKKPKNMSNRLPRTAASSKLGKGRARAKQQLGSNSNSRRSAETIQRLKMYTTGKAIRNRHGKVVAGTFQMADRAGDGAITSQTGRIEPDRRWFGNTRTVGATELDAFRESMTNAVSDPYSVVLKRQKLPMGLLQDAAEQQQQQGNKPAALLEQEPFEQAFGSKARRKRVKLDQLLVGRDLNDNQKKQKTNANKATPVGQPAACGYAALVQAATKSQETYEHVNTAEGIVPWGRDDQQQQQQASAAAAASSSWMRPEKKDDLFLKGQSKRIWGEFFKVVDCSDVVLHVIDARNVPGTRCTMIEKHIRDKANHKHLVFILNKIDLVPNWVAKRWMGELAKSRPTIAFHASLTNAFGKGALISLLRQFGKLHQDKKEISVGVIGYPNVGKSSVINTLISKKSCKVAPIPGETKIWQYVSLFKRISLIDCPGVVVDTAGDSETDSVLKGVVRAERLEHPEDFVDAVQQHVKRQHICAQYQLSSSDTWQTSVELMELIAKRYGRLRKGGEPCLRSAAIMILNDFQRGRLPHYVAPPELKDDNDDDDDDTKLSAVDQQIQVMKQDLDAVGQEKMQQQQQQQQDDEEESASSTKQPEETATASMSSNNPSSTDEPGTKEKTDSDKLIEEDSSAPRQASEDLIGAGEWDD